MLVVEKTNTIAVRLSRANRIKNCEETRKQGRMRTGKRAKEGSEGGEVESEEVTRKE